MTPRPTRPSAASRVCGHPNRTATWCEQEPPSRLRPGRVWRVANRVDGAGGADGPGRSAMSVARSHSPVAPTPHPCADHRCTSIHETRPARASCAAEPHGAGRSRPLPRGQSRRPGGRRPLRAAGHRTLRTPPFHVKHRDGLGPAVPSCPDLSPITRSRSHATRHRRCRSGVTASGAGHGCVGFTWNKLGLGPGGPPDATIAPRTGTRVDRGLVRRHVGCQGRRQVGRQVT
jgi:hypothetical protein